jgi:hypothetical protein
MGIERTADGGVAVAAAYPSGPEGWRWRPARVTTGMAEVRIDGQHAGFAPYDAEAEAFVLEGPLPEGAITASVTDAWGNSTGVDA